MKSSLFGAYNHNNSGGHSIDQFRELKSTHKHGEFRVDEQGQLYVAKEGLFGRNVKSLPVSPGTKAERQEALNSFKEMLESEFPGEGENLFNTAIGRKHPDRLNVNDLGRIWKRLEVPAQAQSSASSASSRPSVGGSRGDARIKIQEQLNTVEGIKAKAEMHSALAGVADDIRLNGLIDKHHPGFTERMRRNGLTSQKFIASLVPVVSIAIKFSDAAASNAELKMLKNMREAVADAGEPRPLLSACLETLEDHNRVKRNKTGAAVVVNVAMTAVSAGTGGVAAPVGSAVSDAAGALAGKALGKIAETVTSTVAGFGATKSAQAHAEHRVKDLQSGIDQRVGSGDQLTDLRDYKTVRALLAYLGPSDQTEAIENDGTIGGGDKPALLDQEAQRLKLKGMFGSSPQEHLDKGLSRTDDDEKLVKDLRNRDTKGKGPNQYEHLSGIDSGDKPSELRTLWMVEGMIGNDNTLERVAGKGKDLAADAARSARSQVTGTQKYDPLREFGYE